MSYQTLNDFENRGPVVSCLLNWSSLFSTSIDMSAKTIDVPFLLNTVYCKIICPLLTINKKTRKIGTDDRMLTFSQTH